jgi:hypothetical protein
VRNEMAVSSELVNTILARTREGKLTCEELSLTGFMARVGQTIIIVDRSPGSQITLHVTDETGKLIELINNEPFTADEILIEIYELARRQALKVDETLSELKRKLDAL